MQDPHLTFTGSFRLLTPQEREAVGYALVRGYLLADVIGEPFGPRYIPHVRREEAQAAYIKGRLWMVKRPNRLKMLLEGYPETRIYAVLIGA